MVLNIPIRIEALYLDSPRQVASPLADFSKLPWNDGTQDRHFSQPFVGDGIIHQPFGSQNLLLGKGLHLHFIIPHYLGQHIPKVAGLSEDQQLPNVGKLPTAPNRWLISRTYTDNSTKKVNVSQWVIDSDFIHLDEKHIPQEPCCVIPFHQGQPYRYMGLKTPQSSPSITVESLRSPSSRPAGSYFKQLNTNNQGLTVIGYGDINFSSFYPNCLGVFGFYDPNPVVGASYEISGINYDVEDDFLSQFIPKLFQTGAQQTQKNPNYQFDIGTALKNSLKLKLDSSTSIQSSDTIQSVFTGSFNFDKAISLEPDTSTFQIAIGNNSTEALSSLIAKNLSSEQNTPNLKSIIEDQLESILLFSKLDHLTVDTGPKFLEARHEKGFRSSNSGALWKIVSTTKDKNTSLSESEVDEINPYYQTKLEALNALKQQFDKNRDELAHLKEQLYLDWYKYMLAAYPPLEGRGQFPDPDHIRYFIETYSFPEIQALIDKLGELTIVDESTGFIPKLKTGDANSSAQKIVHKWTELNSLIQSSGSDNNKLSLTLDNGKDYWEPTDPCILISGLPDITDNDVYNDNGYLVINSDSTTHTFSMSSQKWTPFLLDWEVDLKNSNLSQSTGGIDAKGIENKFHLNQMGPDFTASDGSGRLSVFSGTVMMSQHAKASMKKHIEEFFESLLKQKKVSFSKDDDLLELVKTTFKLDTTDTSLSASEYKSNPILTAYEAYEKLSGIELVAQTLNGFNEACVMKKKTAQLPIREPIGFEDSKAFTKQVNQYVNHHQTVSPVMAFDFNPIRSGNLDLNRLRLTDNFGVSHDVPTSNPSIAQPVNEGNGTIALKPRLTQPARLIFDWVPQDLTSSNNPICGWLMANYWNDSISVFDSTGFALGSISETATWNLPPWKASSDETQPNIADPTLSSVVNWIINTYKSSSSEIKINDFLTATQSALNNIAPANAHLYDIKAMLMGRPMAVVKATLTYGLKELPVIDQSWSSLLYDLSNCDTIPGYSHKDRLNKNWTDIKLPVRLGEHQQLNDGLVGYWVTSDITNSSNSNPAVFISPEADASSLSESDSALKLYQNGNFQTQWLPLSNGSLELTMLIDPRGVVHATPGFLPTKSLQIENKYYLDVIKKLNMWFKVGPMVQPQSMNTKGVSLNLPPVPDSTWNWFDKNNTPSAIKPDGKSTNVQTPTQLTEGWLILKKK